jgi:undecaprenyl-diphosphatase
MNFVQVAVLAVIQGLAELLPVSSSAHVIVAEKLMGLDPSSPQMTFLLVALHTGTMFAVLLYFWPRWRARWTKTGGAPLVRALVIATAATGAVGIALKELIEKIWLRGAPKAEVEALFSNLPLIATSLAAAGLVILWAGSRDGTGGAGTLNDKGSGLVGAVQGLCLPFRGFSRSGATISTALLAGVSRALAEDFSFALAVILTPPVIARETLRLVKAAHETGVKPDLAPGLAGMVLSFGAGLLALRWLSDWLERGRWKHFGWYCLAAAAAVFALSAR